MMTPKSPFEINRPLEVRKDSKHSSAARLFSHATYMGMAKVFNGVRTLVMFANKGMYLELTCYTA